MKKRYIVHVEGHNYSDEATYRILADSADEAKRKVEDKFKSETGDDWDFIDTKIKTRCGETIHRSRLPLKYLKSFCKINASVWNFNYPNRTKFVYWLAVLLGISDKNKWKYNYLDLVIDDDENCIGYLMAFVSDKPKIIHPVLILIHLLVCFLLLFSKGGRGLLTWRKMYRTHQDTTIRLGKSILLGKDYKKVSEGITVAIYPEYHKKGIYREMVKRLMAEVNGFFIFHTSTECDYQAHEVLGYRKIFECPYFYPEKETTFIMYGTNGMLK